MKENKFIKSLNIVKIFVTILVVIAISNNIILFKKNNDVNNLIICIWVVNWGLCIRGWIATLIRNEKKELLIKNLITKGRNNYEK